MTRALHHLRLTAFAASLVTFLPVYASAQAWTAPTPEELSMTSIPQVPGAPAVYLYKEQTTDDGLHMFSYYTRLKVLTEKGKEYANVELPYVGGYLGTTIDSIAGRTIQPDGSIVLFKDKPYDKLIVKTSGFKYQAKVFTLPAVQVGSIVEYRYKLRMDDHFFMHPDWILQGELYVRKAHYMWRPTNALLTSEDGKTTSASVAWTPILPAGVKVKQTELHTSLSQSSADPTVQLDLDVQDIAPLPKEEYMPPVESLSYRVMFYYTDVRTAKEFWEKEGKRWSKDRDKFIGPKDGVRSYANSLVAATDTQDQKARKLYDAVMLLENTDFSRTRTTTEDKAEGLKHLASTDDILARKRGEGDQLAELYVAMCRSVGLKAYLMGVADRSRRIFLPNFFDLNGQIDDYIAIVNVDGKDVYFDPGRRYCAPEHLVWQHTMTGGIRQTDGGTMVTGTSSESFKSNVVARGADLKLDDTGIATGTVTLSYMGDDALRWRQEALKGDDTSLNEDLKAHLERLLPGGMDVRITSVDGLAKAEGSLTIHYEVKGAIGSPTGKRLLVPADVFVANEKPRFTSEKREIAIDMHAPSATVDNVRITYPDSMVVESTPAPTKEIFDKNAAFITTVTPGANNILFHRNLTNGVSIYLAPEYAALRAFFTKVETKDQETLVLTRATPGAPAAATSAAKTGGN
jgi:hypothetical protein